MIMDFEINWTVDLPEGWEYQGNPQVDVKLGFMWQDDFLSGKIWALTEINNVYLSDFDPFLAKCVEFHCRDDMKLSEILDKEAISRGYIEPDPGHADLNWMDTKI